MNRAIGSYLEHQKQRPDREVSWRGLDSAPAVTLAAHPDMIRKELKIPDGLSIIIGIALGYADAGHPQNKYRTPRRSIQEAVTFKGI